MTNVYGPSKLKPFRNSPVRDIYGISPEMNRRASHVELFRIRNMFFTGLMISAVTLSNALLYVAFDYIGPRSVIFAFNKTSCTRFISTSELESCNDLRNYCRPVRLNRFLETFSSSEVMYEPLADIYQIGNCSFRVLSTSQEKHVLDHFIEEFDAALNWKASIGVVRLPIYMFDMAKYTCIR